MHNWQFGKTTDPMKYPNQFSTSIKDSNGSISGGERIVRGPIASLSCTTKGETYEDNISRSFLIAVDESREQTLRVIQYQNNTYRLDW